MKASRKPNSVPWEIRVQAGLSASLMGSSFRLPRSYGYDIDRKARRASLFMEDVEIAAPTDPVAALCRRATALGELATSDDLRAREYAAERRRTKPAVNAAEAAVRSLQTSEVSTGELEAAFQRAADAVTEAESRTRLKLGLAHGDAHSNNLLMPKAGPVVMIDLGSLCLAPIGSDLAPLVVRLLGARSAVAARRWEELAVQAFMRGAAAGDPTLSEPEVRLAYAGGLAGQCAELAERLARQAARSVFQGRANAQPFVKRRLKRIVKILEHATDLAAKTI